LHTCNLSFMLFSSRFTTEQKSDAYLVLPEFFIISSLTVVEFSEQA
jgi:hypothetical protein